MAKTRKARKYKPTSVAARIKPTKAKGRKKDTRKLTGRFALDFAAVHSVQMQRAGMAMAPAAAAKAAPAAEDNPAMRRMCSLAAQNGSAPRAVVSPTRAHWTPMGPLAVPKSEAANQVDRILVSGRVTAIAPHPTDGDTIFIGTSRGGVWRTSDGGNTWAALGDDQPSLAIGALAIAVSNPNVLYAGTGEGNLQFYSTIDPLRKNSPPGFYLGVGVLRSIDGGASWELHALDLLAQHSFYRIVVDRGDDKRAFAATSRGLCRTTDGVHWVQLSDGGLPTIGGDVIACTDVLIDSEDRTGNTVYAAFWNSGIYKSINALAASPTFTPLTIGLPAGNKVGRISLKQSVSSPAHKYALIASAKPDQPFPLGVYRTTNAAGTVWELCTKSREILLYGDFTNDVNVDPTTPDVIYVSGVHLYKCQRNAAGTWRVTNIGGKIHVDNHAFGFHPALNQTIYSGNDGGFFVSRDGGATWDDSPNEGLCLMQYQAIDNHGRSDAFLQCGSQDNGTQQYRNSPVHYHSADGDGGYCAVSKVNGNNVMHSFLKNLNSPRRSTAAGRRDSYVDVGAKLPRPKKNEPDPPGIPFYPPAAISPTSERMAWCNQIVYIDDRMGTGNWTERVSLPGINGVVSAVSFTNDTLIYCATTSGQVYRLDQSGRDWTARALHAAPLPAGQWIWDVASPPGEVDTVVVAFSGFGLVQHVWRGAVPAAGAANWVAVSNGLPDVPMYALAFGSTRQWFLGTDIGVFRSEDAGGTWINFSQGLPKTAIYDLRLRSRSNLLRAATYGRGLWEVRIDLATQPTADIFVRNHIMDDGRAPSGVPEPAAWDDPTRYISLNDPCYWWQCADIKIDAPPRWQLESEGNYLKFETELSHESPEKGKQNRVYVQVHNRGPLAANNVTVKIMAAAVSAGLSDLPADFWTTWPHSAGNAHWTPVGAPKKIDSLEPLRPTVLQWDWTPDATADAHHCMLVVMDSPGDPVPETTKSIFNIAQLVTNEKRAGLKNFHVINLLPNTLRPLPWYMHGSRALRDAYMLRIPALAHPQLRVDFFLSKALSKRLFAAAKLPKGLRVTKLAASDLAQLKQYWLKNEMRNDASWESLLKTFDVSQQFSVDPRSKGADLPVSIKAGAREDFMLLVRSGKLKPAERGSLAIFTLQQTNAQGEVVGGSTFVFKPVKSDG